MIIHTGETPTKSSCAPPVQHASEFLKGGDLYRSPCTGTKDSRNHTVYFGNNSTKNSLYSYLPHPLSPTLPPL